MRPLEPNNDMLKSPNRRRLIGGAICSLGVGYLAFPKRSLGLQRPYPQEEYQSLLQVEQFRHSSDGEDWAPAFNRALAEAGRRGKDVEVGGTGQRLPLFSLVEIVPENDGWTPTIYAKDSIFVLHRVGSGFRYRGIKDGAPANAVRGGIQDCIIDYGNLGDPAVNAGPRGVFLSNAGGELQLFRVRGVNISFGYHIQNWRYADGGRPGGGLTTIGCDCRGPISSDRSRKWYPFGDQGDLTIDMPGDIVPAGEMAVIATTEDAPTSYGARRPARAMFWANDGTVPVRVPNDLSRPSLMAAGLTEKGEKRRFGKQELDAITYAYWSSGGAKKPDCVVQAQTGLISSVKHDGGYYGTMLQGTREYVVADFQSRNNVRGIVGQQGAKNVHLSEIRISETLSSAILAGYNAPGWSIEEFLIEASNDRWVGEALINLQLGAAGATIGRGNIRMGDNQKNGQYAVKFGPNSPGCRIEGPLQISGDCARAYVAVESAWNDRLAATYPESYSRFDYRGIASVPMDGIQLRNITIAANSRHANVPTAIAIIQASDGNAREGFHGEIGISDLVIENVIISSTKHVAYLKFIQPTGTDPNGGNVRNVELSNFRIPRREPSGSAKLAFPRDKAAFRCIRNVSSIADRCRP